MGCGWGGHLAEAAVPSFVPASLSGEHTLPAVQKYRSIDRHACL